MVFALNDFFLTGVEFFYHFKGTVLVVTSPRTSTLNLLTFLARFCSKLKFVTSAVFAPYPGFVKNDVIDHHLLRQGKHSHKSPSAVHGLEIHFETSFTALREPLLFAPCLSYCRICLLILYSTTL